MAVHFLHTSDWHLGQFFHNHDREFEHAQFLNWLLEQIKEKQPHALLIAGDILTSSILLPVPKDSYTSFLLMPMNWHRICKP